MPRWIKFAAVLVLLFACPAPFTAGQELPREPVARVFERPAIQAQARVAFARLIATAVPDPKGEFRAFLIKPGLVVLRRKGEPALQLIENPNAGFLSAFAALYDDSAADEKLLALRDSEPGKFAEVASYSARRALEELQRSREKGTMKEAGRLAIARAVIEEVVAAGCLDHGNGVMRAVETLLAGEPDRDSVLGYGYALIEYDEPSDSQWEALAADAKGFLLRFSKDGFRIYSVAAGARNVFCFSDPAWSSEIARLFEGLSNPHPDRPWMGFSPSQQRPCGTEKSRPRGK